MRVVSKAILIRQMSASDYADEFKMAVGDALEEFAERHLRIQSIAELADLVGLSEKRMANILSGDTELKISDLARCAYMMGCQLRIVLESESKAKTGGAD